MQAIGWGKWDSIDKDMVCSPVLSEAGQHGFATFFSTFDR
jgi:hypothetical protein